MTQLESAVFDLVRSMAGDPTPIGILRQELRLQERFWKTNEAEVAEACSSLAAQSKIWYAANEAKLRHHEPKPAPQGMLF